MLQSFVGWALIMLGLATLSEGYYAFRQRTDHLDGRFWWVGGVIWGAGLAAIQLGLALAGDCAVID